MQAVSHGQSDTAQPSYWQQFWLWLRIGAQSFGGGSATLYYIRRTLVDQRGWVDADTFVRYWSICQVAPGINLLGLTTLIGWQTGGALGVIIALAGLLLPSVAITVALTAVYASIQGLAAIQAALRGIVAASVGLSALLTISMLQPPLQASRAENWRSTALCIVVVLASAALVGIWHAPVVGVLWGAGAICAVAHALGIARKAQQ